MAASQRWFWLGVVPIVCGALIAWLGSPRVFILPARKPAVEEKAASHQESPAAANVPLIGSAGCSARSCHGSLDARSSTLDPDKCRQNEYVSWANDDPHAEAYRVLFNDRSKRIMKLLQSGKSNRPVGAQHDPRCLACHTNPRLSGLSISDKIVREEQPFGVGCESCHGGASKWLVPHTDKSWRQISPKEKWEKYDMVPVTDPMALAQTCVGCHIGAPADPAKGLPLQDVNHDLIAAGHPRLNFEFGSFLANLPPHWRPRKKPEAAYWAVGQHVSAGAALDLLAERARSGPWPEFAEYDCYSCHHSLTQPSWRQKAANRRPGSLSWGSWYYPLLRAGDKDLDPLAAIMEKPMPNRKDAHELALTVRRNLPSPAVAVADIDKFFHAGMSHIAAGKVDPSWDCAEQIYLGMSALNLSQPNPSVTKLLQELTPIRAFPPGIDGPTSWPVKGRQPFDPDAFFDKLGIHANPKR